MDYDFDEIQDKLEHFQRGSAGKKHSDHHGKKTSNFIRDDFVKHNHDLQIKESKNRIEKVILDFPDFKDNEDLRNRFLDRYIGWVKECLTINKLIFREEKDIDLDFSRSSSHGGQNVNKVETAVRVNHIISNISVHNEETRDQIENRQKAVKLLKEKLAEHLQDWATVTQGKNPQELTRYDVLEIPSEKLTF